MRTQLLDAVMAVYPAGRDGAPAVIDDVIRHAHVSRGTFYKYFDSLDQAVVELGSTMATEMVTTIGEVYHTITEPAMRTATGFQSFLLRAKMDRGWGIFVAHIGLLTGDNPMVRQMLADIRLGIATGEYAVGSVELAGDLLLGAKVEAIRRIITGSADDDYIRGMTAMVLRSFGVAPARADKVVAAAYRHLEIEGPLQIPWWQPADQ